MAEQFHVLSQGMADVARTAGNAIVQVNARRRVPASGIIWSEQGIVVTAHHVVRSDDVELTFSDGTRASAELVGRDPSTDLALLRTGKTELQAASWSDDFAVGHLVLALARPGRTVQATLGVVSALDGSWRTPTGGQIDRYVQTDVLMYPGFSGGGLVDSVGQFIGLNSSALRRGASITVPASTLRSVVETLLAHGHVRRGYLGVSTQAVRLPDTIAEQVGQKTGLLIVSVEDGSPAGEGGLVLGDTIVGLDGLTVQSHDDLVAALSGERVGQKVPVRIVRGGELRDLNVTVGERA